MKKGEFTLKDYIKFLKNDTNLDIKKIINEKFLLQIFQF